MARSSRTTKIASAPATSNKLTLDNDGAHFCWTPNVQIISKVYLRRKDQPRTYALNKKDAKMVSDAAKKKL